MGRINSMPLTTDPLDAVRARFQERTMGGYEYEIFAERKGRLYGLIHGDKERAVPSQGPYMVSWSMTGQYAPHDTEWNLIPANPNAALIAELRTYARLTYAEVSGLLERAIEALERKP